VRGTLMQLAQEIGAGNFGTAEAAKRIQQAAEQLGAEYTYQPRTEQGQEMTQAAGEFAGRYLAPMAGATGELAAAGQAYRMGGPIIPATAAGAGAASGAAGRAAGAAGRAAGAVVQPFKQGAESVAQGVRRVGDVVGETAPAQFAGEVADLAKGAMQAGRTKKDADAVTRAKAQPYNVENAPVLVQGPKGAERIVADTLAEAAIKQGWQPGVIAAMKAGSDLDRAKALQMIGRYEAGKVDEMARATDRPTDIIGQSVDTRVKALIKNTNQSGKDIDRIAKEQMVRKPVAYEPVMAKFKTALNDIGVTLNRNDAGNLVAVLRGSDIEGDRAAQALLNRILARFDDTDVPDAYKAHLAKRFIDTQVQYGKSKANPLTQQAERIVKGLRRDLNAVLGEAFPDYKSANTKYSENIGALDELQKAVGKKIDFESPNADKALGQEMRKLLSNYASRVTLMDSLALADDVAARYGLKINDNIINQVIVANEIDRMFGATASGSFKGQIEQALSKGIDIARGDSLTAAIDLVKAGIDKSRGVNEKNSLKAIKELLRRKMETKEPNTLPVAPE